MGQGLQRVPVHRKVCVSGVHSGGVLAPGWSGIDIYDKRVKKLKASVLTLLCRDDKIRTCDPYVPNVVRYQLRYIPIA